VNFPADAVDPDADGHNTWQEWRCLNDPTNALSVLRLLSASPAGTNVNVSWQSVEGMTYFLERSTNLWASPPFFPAGPEPLRPSQHDELHGYHCCWYVADLLSRGCGELRRV
jgi:hypothetical protein